MRTALGLLALGVVVTRIGTGPFVHGLRLVDPVALLVATAVTALTTTCAAWRWCLVAESLGVEVGLREAVAAVYRAQFLNATLPSGLVGDVDRAVGHGRGTGAMATSIRSVVWERAFGQVVQVAITLAVLLVLPSPLHALAPVVAAIGLAVLLTGRAWSTRLPRTVRDDLRRIGAGRWAAPRIGLASATAVCGHLVVLLVAARTAGVPGPAYVLLPLAAIVLLGSSVPLSVAGWGPREGVAAWAFAAGGLGAGAGVTTSVVYGVMTLVATLPGAVVLLAGQSWSGARVRSITRPTAVLEGASSG